MFAKWKFWLTLAFVFFIFGIFFLPFSPVRFGGFFLGALGFCCAMEAFFVAKERVSPTAHKIAQAGRILFALFCVSFIGIQALIIAGQTSDSEAEDAQYVLVLGAHILQNRPSDALIERCKTAADYLNTYPNATAILCGGQGTNEPMPESHMMRKYMIETLQVDSNRLLVEDTSRNTIQNIQNAKKLYHLQDYRCAVLSSDFHLARARRLMEQAGLEPYGISAPMPDVPLIEAASHMREYCSTLGLLLTGRYF